MGGRIGVGAGVASFASLIIVAVVQAAGWIMPVQLAIPLLAFMGLMGGIAGLVVVWEVYRLSIPVVKRHRLRWPIVNREAPDPHQWLLDIAQRDAEDPGGNLLIMDTRIADKKLDPSEFRPWIELGFTLYNAGVHAITVGQATGHMVFQGRELPEPVEASRLSNKPRRHLHEYRVKQVLPKEIAELVLSEIEERGMVWSLGVSGIRVHVESSGENGRTVDWPLQGDSFRHG